MRRNLILSMLAALLSCVGISAEAATMCGSRAGMIPNDISAASKNATILANLINSGKTVKINKPFYIGESSVDIVSDVIIKGTSSGKLILTGVKTFKLGKTVSISVSKLSVSTKGAVSAVSSPILFMADKPLMHKDVTFSKMVVDGVRLYSQKKDDGYTGNVGLRKLVFSNNEVKSVGRHLIYLADCQADEVMITDNRVTNMLSIAFLIGLNDISDKHKMVDRVIIRNNRFDNSGVELTDDYSFTYHTPFIVEANKCECTGNVFKNFVSIASKPIALYAAYLSCNRVVFDHNTMVDCIALGNSTYNEVFKCKSAPTKGEFRLLTNNKFIVTKELIAQHKLGEMPKVSLLGIQMPAMDTVIMTNNKVDLACDFVFGATTQCEYKLFRCENNDFAYRKYGKAAKQLIRLKPSKGSTGHIVIRNNTMRPQQEAEDVYGLYAYDSDNYKIVIEDNVLSGALPYGDNDGKSHQGTTLSSHNNRIDLGSYAGAIRISQDMDADDEISGGKDYQIRIYSTEKSQGSISWTFRGSKPATILPAYSGSDKVNYSVEWESTDDESLSYTRKTKDDKYINKNSLNSKFKVSYIKK
mgnify:CR=1 FL=1